MKTLTQFRKSTRTGSVQADLGGRTEQPYGLQRRDLEWLRLPEPCPPQAGCWCSRRERRPDVRLIVLGNEPRQVMGSDLGYRNSLRRLTHVQLNPYP
jgi:hypothetical protein